MPLRIEDYAVIGDTQSAALVGKDGSIDWLCFPASIRAPASPRSSARRSMAALLAPEAPVRETRRRYLGESLVLETEFHTDEGVVRGSTKCPSAPAGSTWCAWSRVKGRVRMKMELVIRFDYGSIVPWVRKTRHGPAPSADRMHSELFSPVPTRGEGLTTVASFDVRPGDRVPFQANWYPSHEDPPPRGDPIRELTTTQRHWQHWSARCSYQGPWREAVVRSLLTLKALTYAPTGGIAAAVPPRFPSASAVYGTGTTASAGCGCDALPLRAPPAAYHDEARAWRDWLLRSVAGTPDDLRALYGVQESGACRARDPVASWLRGQQAGADWQQGRRAAPAGRLRRADGCALHREPGGPVHQRERLASGSQPHAMARAQLVPAGRGIWEVRGPRRHFTHPR